MRGFVHFQADPTKAGTPVSRRCRGCVTDNGEAASNSVKPVGWTPRLAGSILMPEVRPHTPVSVFSGKEAQLAKFKVVTQKPTGVTFDLAGGSYELEMESLASVGAEIEEIILNAR